LILETKPESDVYDVFISHRSLYKPWVITLANNLRNRRYKVWLDDWELVPGRNFAEGLHGGLQKSRKGILVATPDSVESGWGREEYEIMLNRKQHAPAFSFVPLVFGDFPDLPFLENVHCVDFRDHTELAYRRAFYRLLCGLEDKAPGPDGDVAGHLEIPKPIIQTPQPVQGSEKTFLEQIFETLAGSHQPLMLLSQADQGQGDVVHALLEKAKARFGRDHTFHIMPPYSPETTLADYFAYLGLQCQMPEKVDSALAWEVALDRRLKQGEQLFLLISRFEHGVEAGRRELAGVLRGLSERHAQRLKLVLCGGERLAELKYGAADMSLLNHADVLDWPDPTVGDVLTRREWDFADLALSESDVQALLTLCGGHPRLLRFCLKQRKREPNATVEKLRQALEEQHFVAEPFIRLRGNADVRERLCNWLADEDVAPFDPWPLDRLLAQLYWNNLLIKKNRRFVWRCEILRTVGLRTLQCGTP